jgi:hypothetical protein
MTSIPKIRRLVEILMFNLKNESHVQVAKKKKNRHNPYLF